MSGHGPKKKVGKTKHGGKTMDKEHPTNLAEQMKYAMLSIYQKSIMTGAGLNQYNSERDFKILKREVSTEKATFYVALSGTPDKRVFVVDITRITPAEFSKIQENK